jgi:phosphoglycolate phosphatase
MIRYFFRGVMVNQGKNPFGVYSGEIPGQPDKPNPARALELAAKLKCKPENVALVGDSPIDIETAKNAGMIAVGAAWGYSSREALEKAGADYIFDTPQDMALEIEKLPII